VPTVRGEYVASYLFIFGTQKRGLITSISQGCFRRRIDVIRAPNEVTTPLPPGDLYLLHHAAHAVKRTAFRWKKKEKGKGKKEKKRKIFLLIAEEAPLIEIVNR
jgi:hypothetical protein